MTSSQKPLNLVRTKLTKPLSTAEGIVSSQLHYRDGCLSSTEDMTAINSQHFEGQTPVIMMSKNNADESSMHFINSNENQSVKDAQIDG